MKQIFLFFFLLSITNTGAQAYDLLVVKDDTKQHPKDLSLHIENLSFIKNNEYFNLIADGYTLLGNKINIDLTYQPHKNYEITGGLMLLKYYGQEKIDAFIPYFSLDIQKGNHRYIFGKLATNDRHWLPVQLYNFERLLDKRSIENGLEHRYHNRHWQTDTWLEWEHFIHKNDRHRERLNFGHSTHLTFLSNNWEIKIPLHLYIHHRGGQINLHQQNNKLNNALIVSNASAGFSVAKKFNKQFQTGILTQYFIHHINSNNTEEYIFREGSAYQWQFFIKNKNWEVDLNYWKSKRFVSVKGDDMFQSVSQRVDKYLDDEGHPIPVFSSYSEPNRQLLYGNIGYKKEIIENLYLAFSTGIYYQLNESQISTSVYSASLKNQIDYNMGLYLIYKFDYRLLQIK